jgi:voltage-gated potassium channel
VSGLFFISIRRLRAPLVLIIAIFALSTAGLALIPGVDADGNAWRPSIFEAFYFVTYTATTIGFGELPFAFTNLQRLWVTAIIYLSVIGWAYLLGNLLALVQDKGFQAALVAARFGRSIRHLREPFYLLCGLGETGITVARALDRMGERFVALDADEARVLELDLGDFATDPPALAGDVSSPETLVLAGLSKPECRGVLALTPDDHANLAVAVAARLLHPGLRTIARAHSSATMDAMQTAGVDEIINPYREFAERLTVAVRAPDTHRLLAWLTGPPGAALPPRIPAPPGRWIVCGYGRFGEEVVRAIRATGFDVAVIDPDEPPSAELRMVQGLGSDHATLRQAGILDAEGIVAGSDDDIANLAMAMAARQLNPEIFVIARQNRVRNHQLFRAFHADMTVVPNEIIANEAIACLRARHLSGFIALAYGRDNAWAEAITARLAPILGSGAPEVWGCALDPHEAPGLLDVLEHQGATATVGDLCRDIADRTRALPCLALLVVRDGERIELPGDTVALRPGDELLFAGRETARRTQRQTLLNANTAEYVVTGHDRPDSVLARLLAGRTAGQPAG